jgi:hypothetical protein
LWELEREIISSSSIFKFITISVFLTERDPRFFPWFFLYDLSSLNRLERQAALVFALQSELNKEGRIKGPWASSSEVLRQAVTSELKLWS